MAAGHGDVALGSGGVTDQHLDPFGRLASWRTNQRQRSSRERSAGYDGLKWPPT